MLTRAFYLLLSFLALSLSLFARVQSDPLFPNADGLYFVEDSAQLFDEQEERSFDKLLKEIWQKQSWELHLLIVPTVDPDQELTRPRRPYSLYFLVDAGKGSLSIKIGPEDPPLLNHAEILMLEERFEDDWKEVNRMAVPRLIRNLHTAMTTNTRIDDVLYGRENRVDPEEVLLILFIIFGCAGLFAYSIVGKEKVDEATLYARDKKTAIKWKKKLSGGSGEKNGKESTCGENTHGAGAGGFW